MSFTHWLSERLGLSGIREQAGRRAAPRKRPTFRPTLQALEERWAPSTLTVTSIADSGAGSLRAEIQAAHHGDTINFAPSLSGQTITLSSGELYLNKNLTIAGPTDRSVTVSGGGLSRVFEVAKGTDTLSGLTISHGSSGMGGGIAVDSGATLTVSNCILSNNVASTPYGDGYGGGISNYGQLTVSGCTLSHNSAGTSGGGISNNGTSATLTLSNSTLIGNAAIQADGGGLAEFGGTLTVSGTNFSNNSAGGSGGAIFVGGSVGTTTLTNDTMQSNTATTSGGGLYIAYAGTVSLDAFTVANTINNTDSSGLNGPTANIDGSYTLI